MGRIILRVYPLISFSTSTNTTCHSPLFFSQFQRWDIIRESCVRADRSGHLSILFSSPSLYNCRFTCMSFCDLFAISHANFFCRLINELHLIIYRSLWAEYLTFPYQILSPKNVLPSSTFDFAICTRRRTLSEIIDNDGANRKSKAIFMET